MKSNNNIKLKLTPITKLNKKLDEASKVISFNKTSNVSDTIKYFKSHKVELLVLLNKNYDTYLEKFKGFIVTILVNNKECKSFTFTYSTLIK